MMKKIFFLLLFLSYMQANAQSVHGETEISTITDNGEEINFLKISKDLTARKPVIVFCLGSFPTPLIIQDGDEVIIPYLKYVAYEGLSDDYHLVLVGKPNTPATAKREELSNQFTVVTDRANPFSFTKEFLDNNYLEKHVSQTTAVIRHLATQPWVDPSRILLMGHSQGAHVTAHTALQCPIVNALGYFGGNPFGRFAQFVTAEKYKEITGEISSEEATMKLDELYYQWEVICRDIARDTNGDPDHTWKSFSRMYVDKLTALKVPVYVAYGTKDPGGHLCYLLPIYFELAGKTDYLMRPYPGRGHNFEELTAEGKSDMDTSLWHEAMREFVAWVEKNMADDK